jgi:KaiC/GvpD/RAD55 family RecA-like ATPase
MKKVNIKKILSEKQTILLSLDSKKYNEISRDIAKQLSGKKVCYITLSKTCESVRSVFKEKKVNSENFIIIDAISKTIRKMPDKEGNCRFTTSPAALTELSLVITDQLNSKIDYLVFDSLTTLLVYQKADVATRFVSSIINKIKGNNTKAIFYVLPIKEHEGFFKECCLFVDEVVDFE